MVGSERAEPTRKCLALVAMRPRGWLPDAFRAITQLDTNSDDRARRLPTSQQATSKALVRFIADERTLERKTIAHLWPRSKGLIG
jgi:hypothetical protein